MSANFSIASAAYGRTDQLLKDTAGSKPTGSGGAEFSKLLAESLQSVVDSGNRADQISMDMLSGKADVVDMVTAIAETELAVESMVTVRDRVISAYEEIMRMPI